jgi:hypothetical protein
MRKPVANPQGSTPQGPAPRGSARYGTPAQIVTAAATSLILVVAVVALVILWQRPETESEAAATETPRQIFHAYLDLAFRVPALAAPNYDAIKANPRERALYEPLVTQLLLSCDAIIASFAEDEDDEAWRSLCGTHITRHARYLCETLNEDALGLYDSENFRDFLVETLTAARGQAAECTTAKLDEIKKMVESLKDVG